MCRAILSSLPSPARQHVVGFPVVPDVYDAHLPQLAESAAILLEPPIGRRVAHRHPRIGPGEQPPGEHLVTAGHHEIDVEAKVWQDTEVLLHRGSGSLTATNRRGPGIRLLETLPPPSLRIVVVPSLGRWRWTGMRGPPCGPVTAHARPPTCASSS